MGSAREEINDIVSGGQLPVDAWVASSSTEGCIVPKPTVNWFAQSLSVDKGKRFDTVAGILVDAARKQPSTQISSKRPYCTPLASAWPVKWAFWQTETGTSAAPLHQTSAKSVLQFRVDESVRDGLARISGEMIERARTRIERPGKNRAED